MTYITFPQGVSTKYALPILSTILDSVSLLIWVYDIWHITRINTVKRKIIGEDLFGEIGELLNFAKISSRQMKKIWTPPSFFQ